MGQVRITTNDYSSSWPSFLQEAAKKSDFNVESDVATPLVVSMLEEDASKKLNDIVIRYPITEIVDSYDEQLAELFISKNPHIYQANLEVKRNSSQDFISDHYKSTSPWQVGSWVYYPWSGRLLHLLSEELFWELRTIRNRDFIDNDEQLTLRNVSIGSAGMSVGSSGALALALQGMSQKLKIADGAVISGSNLNRILTGVQNIGVNKAIAIARMIYEMNPYMQLQVYTRPIDIENINDFFERPWKLDIVIDEIDDILMKVQLRVKAKQMKIPVLMATDLGDDVMLDVERYDRDSNLQLFHGLLGDIEKEISSQKMQPGMFLKYATDIIGIKNMPLKLQRSAMKIGSVLPAPPQLGGTTMFGGAVLSYAVKQIATQQPLKSGRHIISLDRQLISGSHSLKNKLQHRRHSANLQNSINKLSSKQ